MKHLFTLLIFGLCSSFLHAQYISELDADTQGTDTQEFVEIKGTPNASMTGLSLVFFNGSNNLSYRCIDLGAETFPASGVFVVGNAAVPNVNVVIPSNAL